MNVEPRAEVTMRAWRQVSQRPADDWRMGQCTGGQARSRPGVDGVEGRLLYGQGEEPGAMKPVPVDGGEPRPASLE